MAVFSLISTVQPDAASNTSLTSAFKVDPGWNRFAISIPSIASFCITSTCNVKVQVSDTEDGTFYTVAYSANPSTATTGVGGVDWATGNDAGSKMVICEALAFSPGWAKLQFVNTATASADFKIYGSKLD